MSAKSLHPKVMAYSILVSCPPPACFFVPHPELLLN